MSTALVRWLVELVAGVVRATARGAPLRPDEALAACVAAAALAVVAWLAVSVVLELLALLPGVVGRTARRVAVVLTPALVRRAAAALLGVGIVAGLAPGASVASPVTVAVTPGPLPDPGFAPAPDKGFVRPPDREFAAAPDREFAPPDPGSSPLPDPGWAPSSAPSPAPGAGWVPGLPIVRAQPDVRVLSPATRPRSRPDATEEVVVRRGDCLWSIVGRHLGGEASDAEIARAWPAWFEENRALIGDDPDLLRPGQVLRPPEAVQP